MTRLPSFTRKSSPMLSPTTCRLPQPTPSGAGPPAARRDLGDKVGAIGSDGDIAVEAERADEELARQRAHDRRAVAEGRGREGVDARVAIDPDERSGPGRARRELDPVAVEPDADMTVHLRSNELAVQVLEEIRETRVVRHVLRRDREERRARTADDDEELRHRP